MVNLTKQICSNETQNVILKYQPRDTEPIIVSTVWFLEGNVTGFHFDGKSRIRDNTEIWVLPAHPLVAAKSNVSECSSSSTSAETAGGEQRRELDVSSQQILKK